MAANSAPKCFSTVNLPNHSKQRCLVISFRTRLMSPCQLSPVPLPRETSSRTSLPTRPRWDYLILSQEATLPTVGTCKALIIFWTRKAMAVMRDFRSTSIPLLTGQVGYTWTALLSQLLQCRERRWTNGRTRQMNTLPLAGSLSFTRLRVPRAP